MGLKKPLIRSFKRKKVKKKSIYEVVALYPRVFFFFSFFFFLFLVTNNKVSKPKIEFFSL